MLIDIIHNVNLEYPYYDNTIEKLRIIYGIIHELRKNHLRNHEIAYRLGMPISIVNRFSKSKYSKSVRFLEKTGWGYCIRKNTRYFLLHKEPIRLNSKAKGYIIELLASPLSTNEISKYSGVKQPVISYLRNQKRKIGSLSLDTADKLVDLYAKVHTWQTIETLLPKLPGSLRGTERGHVTGELSDGQWYKVQIESYKPHNMKFKDYDPTKITDFTPEITPKSVLKLVDQFTHTPVTLRHADSCQYVEQDLGHKKWLIDVLLLKGYSSKYICRLLHINNYLINLVKDEYNE